MRQKKMQPKRSNSPALEISGIGATRPSHNEAISARTTLQGFNIKPSTQDRAGTLQTERSPQRQHSELVQDSVFSTSRGGGSKLKERLSPIRRELLRGGYPAPIGLEAQRSLA